MLVTDITYQQLKVDTVYYLPAVLDLLKREIVAWRISGCNDLDWVNETLEKLFRSRDLNGMLLHSDQGFQNTSRSYNHKLEQQGIVGSHSRKKE